MKKLIYLIILLLSIIIINSNSNAAVLLNEVIATGDGASVHLGYIASVWTCHITVTGTAPTSVTVKMKGSINGITFSSYTTATYTISDVDSKTFHTYRKPARHLLGNYDSKVGGDGTTAVSLSCDGGE